MMGVSDSRYIPEVQQVMLTFATGALCRQYFSLQGAVAVACSSQITKPDCEAIIVIINNYTTCDDLIDLVLTRCKARCLDAADFCVTMETGPKGGPMNTQILKNGSRPLELQATLPKGQTRFGVQTRRGVVVKLYDAREWPAQSYGDIYLTSDHTTQQTLSRLLGSTVPKKKIIKHTLAIGNPTGKEPTPSPSTTKMSKLQVHKFLADESKPLADYEDFVNTTDIEEPCLLIVKKVKPAKKLMFRSVSWANLIHSDAVKPSIDRKLKKSKKKHKDSKIYPAFSFDGNNDVKPTQNSEPCTLDEQAGFTSYFSERLCKLSDPKRKKSHISNPDNKSATCPRGRGPIQNLTTSFSCENIFSTANKKRPNLNLKPEVISPITESKVQLTEGEQSKKFVVDEDYSNVVRSRSLGDISTNLNLSLPVPSLDIDYENMNDSNMNNKKKNYSPSVDVSCVKLRNNKPTHNKQSRNSCIARMNCYENINGYTESSGSFTENYHDVRRNSAAESEPRMRRTLPEIPNADIDMKKKRFTELMKRRLTVCGGEIPDCDQISFHNNEGQGDETYPVHQEYERGRTFAVQAVPHNNGHVGRQSFVPLHRELSATKSVPESSSCKGSYDDVCDNRFPQGSRIQGRGDARLQASARVTVPNDNYSKSVNYSKEHYPSDHGATYPRSYHPASPGKPPGDNPAEFGAVHVTAQSSMMDSGYGTNGESDYNSLPVRAVDGGYRPNDSDRSPPYYGRRLFHGQGHMSFSSSESDPAISPDCHSSPKPLFDTAKPSFYQILSSCQMFCVEIKPIPNQPIDESLSLMEISVNLPLSSSEINRNAMPKGNYAIGLGGPGSAFKRVKKDTKATKKYSLASIEWVATSCLRSGSHHALQKGDILIEVNGTIVIGNSIADIISLITDVPGPTVELVVAKKKPQDAGKLLPTEISKLRQQCSYLLSEVKNKEPCELAIFKPSDSPAERHLSAQSSTHDVEIKDHTTGKNVNQSTEDTRRHNENSNRKENTACRNESQASHMENFKCIFNDHPMDNGNSQSRLSDHNVRQESQKIPPRNDNYVNQDNRGFEMKYTSSVKGVWQGGNSLQVDAVGDCREVSDSRLMKDRSHDGNVKHTIYQRNNTNKTFAKSVNDVKIPSDERNHGVSTHRHVSPDTTSVTLAAADSGSTDEGHRMDFSPVISAICVQNGDVQKNQGVSDNAKICSDDVLNKIYNRSVSYPASDRNKEKIEETQRYIAKSLCTFAPKNRNEEEKMTGRNSDVKNSSNLTQESTRRNTWNVKSVFKWRFGKEDKKQENNSDQENGFNRGTDVRAQRCQSDGKEIETLSSVKPSNQMTTFMTKSNGKLATEEMLPKTSNQNQTLNGEYGCDLNQNITHRDKYCEPMQNLPEDTSQMKNPCAQNEPVLLHGGNLTNVIRLYNCELGEDEFIV